MRQLRLCLLLCTLLLVGCGSEGNSPIQLNSATAPAALQIDSGVLRWNRLAIDASGLDHSVGGGGEQLGPTRASRAMAIVHIAMHDAVQSIQGRFETFLPQSPVQPKALLAAAVAQAAHDTLVSLYPSQRVALDRELALDLEALPAGSDKDQGQAAGRQAALAILSNRANDGSDAATQSQPYVFGSQPGQWRVDPINPGQSPLGANWSKVRPFVLNSASQFRLLPPPALNSAEYTQAYAEAALLGGDGVITPTQRTAEQTQIGLYWAYDGTPSLCAPPRLYNQIAVALAKQQGLTETGGLARLLALTNIALADAGIACWDSKYFYNYWRPVTGIRESDPGTGPSGLGDGNPFTIGDPTYLPLCAPASNLQANNFTPPFPAYPSGHATFGGALFQVLRQSLGRDDIAFTFVSDEFNGLTRDNLGNVRPLLPRSFSSLSQAEEENGQSRIYLGIHWSFDKTQGIDLGHQVADFVLAHALPPRP